MKPFLGLMKKEWKLGRKSLVWLLLLQMVLVLITYLLGNHYQVPGIMFVGIIPLLLIHILMVPVMLLTLLNVEGKSQLWLHNPQSSILLLGSKLLTGLGLHLISLLFSAVVLVLALMNSSSMLSNEQMQGYGIFELGTVLGVITIFSLFLAVECLLLWVIYHALVKFPQIKNVRWLIITILFFGINFLLNFFQDTALYQSLDEIARVTIFQFNSFSVDTDEFSLAGEVIDFSLLTFSIDTLFVVGLFYLACWVFDRKLEV